MGAKQWVGHQFEVVVNLQQLFRGQQRLQRRNQELIFQRHMLTLHITVKRVVGQQQIDGHNLTGGHRIETGQQFCRHGNHLPVLRFDQFKLDALLTTGQAWLEPGDQFGLQRVMKDIRVMVQVIQSINNDF